MWSLGMVVDEPIDLAEGGVRGTLVTQRAGVLTGIDVAATFDATMTAPQSTR